MTKEQIIDGLLHKHRDFTAFITTLKDPEFLFSWKGEKWSAGQQLEHIRRSVSPLQRILAFPKWIVRAFFKKANRPSKTYESLVQKYLLKLEKGGQAMGRFVPPEVPAGRKQQLLEQTEKKVARMCRSLDRYSEKELDEVVMPHPLLGRITLREMMYFTIYHVEHHHKSTVQNLQQATAEQTT